MSSRQKKNNVFTNRMGIVYFFVLLLGLACFFKIIHLIVFQRSLYQGTAASCLDKTKEGWENNPLAKDSNCQCYVVENNLKPVRGEVFDDKGRVLISNYTVFDITLDGRVFIEKDTFYSRDQVRLESLINTLAANFYNQFKERFPKKNEVYYKRQFTKALKDGKNALIIQSNITNEKQWITSDDTALIAKMPMLSQKFNHSGLNYTYRTVRINPYGEMAKRTLGLNVGDRKYGMEACLDDDLAGTQGSRKFLYVNHARIPLNERVEPFDGRNLVTTLNLEIQNIVHNELQKKLIEQNADWGCAVVMETKTGEIKAISNLRRADKDGLVYSESMEYALHAMVEPGSTFKLASVLAYLEKIEDDTSKQYPILAHTFVRKNKAGTKEYRFPKVDEPGRIESLGTPIEVFQRSSNVGITSMIFDAYSIDQYSAYLSKIDSMFITTSFSTQLGKVQAPNIKRKATDFHTYYNTCFGAGFTMTPMQTLVYFNAVANNGKMLAPLFVKYITDSHDTVAKFSAEVINPQICKKTTIDRAKKYLEAVVQGEYGSARRYKDSHFSFAGKTGTRDIWDEDIKAYNRAKNSVSFCGYFPAENPIYTCIVFMYNVPKKSSIAVEVFAKIGKNIMNIANYSALQEVNRSKPKVLPRINMVNSEQFSLIMNVMGFENQVKTIPGPYVSTGLNQDYSVYYKSAKFNAKEKLPDVSNMIASDAIHELSKAGYKVKIEGRGVVKSKTVDRKNKIIILYLEPPG